MSRNGINDGLKQGRLQGLKSGFGFSRMDSGNKKGLVSEPGMHNKLQDPTLLQGGKKPSSIAKGHPSLFESPIKHFFQKFSSKSILVMSLFILCLKAVAKGIVNGWLPVILIIKFSPTIDMV